MTRKTFHMTNRLEAVDPMVQTLRKQVEEHLSDAIRFRFELGVSEALTNLAIHAQTNSDDASIAIALTLDAGSAIIEIFDPEGLPPFDLRNHATDLADVDVMAEGGRGLGLIMQAADKVDYGPANGRNRLCLTFLDDAEATPNAHPMNGADK